MRAVVALVCVDASASALFCKVGMVITPASPSIPQQPATSQRCTAAAAEGQDNLCLRYSYM
jgi:hypothetical protein